MMSVLFAVIALTSATEYNLVTFDGEKPMTKTWQDKNDPVMGGQSHSTFNMSAGTGHFEGTCAIVPFLKAPGFCKISTVLGPDEKPNYADVSSLIDGALFIGVKSATTAYSGFKVAFSAKNMTRHQNRGAPSFKANFVAPTSDAFTFVRIPWSNFSLDWSEYTGDCDTTDPGGEVHHCCSAEHPEVCPQAQHLAQLTGFEVWAEGVEGDFQLELLKIVAAMSL
jgi:hypothetical protein